MQIFVYVCPLAFLGQKEVQDECKRIYWNKIAFLAVLFWDVDRDIWQAKNAEHFNIM